MPEERPRRRGSLSTTEIAEQIRDMAMALAEIEAGLILVAGALPYAIPGSRPAAEHEGGDDPLLTRKEAAAHLGVTERTIRVWTQERGLPFERLGRSRRYRRSALERWGKEQGDKP